MGWAALGLQVLERPGFLLEECGAGVAAVNGAVIFRLELWEDSVISKESVNSE